MINTSPKKTGAISLDAATRNFAKPGYGGTPVETIVKAAGLHKATTYDHSGGRIKRCTAVSHAVFSEQAPPV
jgi:hypothetical protein